MRDCVQNHIASATAVTAIRIASEDLNLELLRDVGSFCTTGISAGNYILRQTACGGVCSHRLRRHFSFLMTTPPFITNLACFSAVASLRGSPGTAIMSAYFPDSRVPILACHPSNSAALLVAAWMISMGVIPSSM